MRSCGRCSTGSCPCCSPCHLGFGVLVCRSVESSMRLGVPRQKKSSSARSLLCVCEVYQRSPSQPLLVLVHMATIAVLPVQCSLSVQRLQGGIQSLRTEME
jgi:hypothetical protein